MLASIRTLSKMSFLAWIGTISIVVSGQSHSY
jgi:hypothetical protein